MKMDKQHKKVTQVSNKFAFGTVALKKQDR